MASIRLHCHSNNDNNSNNNKRKKKKKTNKSGNLLAKICLPQSCTQLNPSPAKDGRFQSQFHLCFIVLFLSHVLSSEGCPILSTRFYRKK